MKRITRFDNEAFIDDQPATVAQLVDYIWRLQNWLEAESTGRLRAETERRQRGVPADPDDL